MDGPILSTAPGPLPSDLSMSSREPRFLAVLPLPEGQQMERKEPLVSVQDAETVTENMEAETVTSETVSTSQLEVEHNVDAEASSEQSSAQAPEVQEPFANERIQSPSAVELQKEQNTPNSPDVTLAETASAPTRDEPSVLSEEARVLSGEVQEVTVPIESVQQEGDSIDNAGSQPSVSEEYSSAQGAPQPVSETMQEDHTVQEDPATLPDATSLQEETQAASGYSSTLQEINTDSLQGDQLIQEDAANEDNIIPEEETLAHDDAAGSETDSSPGSIFDDPAPHSHTPRSSISSIGEEPSSPVEKGPLPVVSTEWFDKQENVVNEPYHYLISHPGKDVRKQVLAALNVWLQVGEETLDAVSRTITMLHNASLLIDDIQDSSTHRRGAPSAHLLYGTARTINSANYVYFQAQQQLFSLPDPFSALRVFTEELLHLHRGQGMELYWRDTGTVPSEDEYLSMIACKTGGLFRLAARLLGSQCPAQKSAVDLVPLADLLGLIFQIRDDYKSLTCEQMSAAKSYCEDLTEGKFSFPILHAIRTDAASRKPDGRILSILRQHTTDAALKSYAVQYMHSIGSFAYTRERLERLAMEAVKEVGRLEGETGSENKGIRGLLKLLEV